MKPHAQKCFLTEKHRQIELKVQTLRMSVPKGGLSGYEQISLEIKIVTDISGLFDLQN